MALNTKKISQLTLLTNETTGINNDRVYLSGSEYLLVSYNNKSYKLPTSVILGTIIKSIDQTLAEGDEAISTITITTDDGAAIDFHVKNGKKGSDGNRGKTGDRGKQGDHGLIYNTDNIYNIITDSLELDDSSKVLSAKAGKELNNKLNNLNELYLYRQETYDTLLKDNNIDENIKYYIYDEDDVTDLDIDDLTEIKEALKNN